ncbi:aromatic ring-hydroxylating oxygenase subunit alpha [Pyruvatibacter mobilis]|uniref:aromatic ring-hydroxylating oxygenase subunit alpha n=1 Tax=Pyruvatibacter mobilis TaxID=1712261 RepID=UPI003BB1D5CC
MRTTPHLSEDPRQLLPREAYVSQDWFDREQATLFADSWTYAGSVKDWSRDGAYVTLTAGPYRLVVVRQRGGTLAAYHNICRHRGTELLEGHGVLKGTIVCPYHRWTYGLDGSLRGVPNEGECFPGLDRAALGLKPASIGIFKGLVFVHPQPDADFTAWLDGVPDMAWPYDLGDGTLEAGDEIIYDMACNWKVFFENAVDGYHLAYLHENTLGPVFPDANHWAAAGQHLVWYSTERGGFRDPLPMMVEDYLKAEGIAEADGGRSTVYGGVYMLFPTIIVTPSPYGMAVSHLVPVAADRTLLKARNWAPKGSSGRYQRAEDVPGYDPATGTVRSALWQVHPLESHDFQTEDVWVCEKMQRALASPAHEVGPLARGAGAEAPLMFFQEQVLAAMGRAKPA